MVRSLKLTEPAYKFAGGTSSGRGYFCSVHIGAHQAGSLDEYITQEQAKCAAAANAVNVLKTYYADKLMLLQRPSALPVSSNSSDGLQNAADIDSEKGDEQESSGDDFERVVENLLVLLASMPRGIYSHALSLKYQEAFKQNLPSDWLARIKEGYPEFVVDEVDAFRSIVAKRRVKGAGAPKRAIAASSETPMATPVTTPTAAPTLAASSDENRSEPSKQTSPALSALSESSKKEETKEVIPDEAASQTTKVRFSDSIQEKLFSREPGEQDHEIIQPPPVTHPPPFTPPDGDNHWNVFVSVVKTPADFVVRLMAEEYSEQYEQLQRDMQSFYELDGKGEKLSASSKSDSLIGNVYAARAEECWHRVYLHDIIPADEGIADEGIMASVYFIDHGDYETVALDDLRILEQKFMRLPCQAAPACLSGFENMSLEDFTQEMIDRFRDITLAKILPAELVKSLNVAASMGDGGPATIGPFVLKLAMPMGAETVSVEAVENEGEAGAGVNNVVNANPNLLVNDVIMKLVTPQVMSKGASRRDHMEGATPTVMEGQKP